MGRRKIEIQPILHERNRAVTFLKRKNGLFKKAYELGVLCSVDVAVIIFEERPGHHVKLYQYCSTDIQEMVQRHLRYDGEKDTRGPADFSGNATKQMDDNGEGDDDDGDDDDGDSGIRGSSKRSRPDGRLKPPPTMGMGGNDMFSRMTLPTQAMMPGLSPATSSLPISSDRESMHGLKRPRVDHPHPHSRSSSDDPGSAGAAGPYFQSPPSAYPSHSRYPTGQPGPAGPYGNYFGPPQTSPPSSFIPLQPNDYSNRGTAPPTRTGSSAGSSQNAPGGGGSATPGAGGGGAGGYGTPRHGGQQQTYDPSLYPPPPSGMIRHPHLPHASHSQHPTHGNHPGGPGSSADIFGNPVYQLEPDSGQRQAAAAAALTVAQNQFSLEWPVHANSTTASGGPSTGGGNSSTTGGGPGGASSSAGPPSSTSSAGPPSAGGENNWLDFLSGNSANANSAAGAGVAGAGGPGGAGAAAGGGSSHHAGLGERNTLSWERGHEVADMFSGPGGPNAGGGGGPGSDGRPTSGRSASSGNKRGRGVADARGGEEDSK